MPAPVEVAGMQPIPMYSRPDLYEVSYDGVLPREVPFVSALLEQRCGAGARVLELAAGSGRVAIQLAQRGFRMTALDCEREMLARLVANARTAVVEIETIAGDLRSFAIPEKFDAVICMLGVACSAYGDAEFGTMLRSVSGVLRPGGICVLVLIAADDPGEIVPHASEWRAERGDIRTHSWFSYEAGSPAGDPCIVRYEYHIHAIARGEPPVLLRDAGRVRIVSSRFLEDSARAAGMSVSAWYPMFDGSRPSRQIPDKSGAAVAMIKYS